ELAELSGGAYVDFADFRRVSSIVPARRQVREVVRVTAAIDHPLLIAGLVLALLVLEWSLRKLWGLV
ncbi:MAG: hypothetical protein O7J95_18435, partial [Planctomycetota bacterium]|nr:hypothetical protein [Planctomycetota bacterium]